jgi:hypothetical protein
MGSNYAFSMTENETFLQNIRNFFRLKKSFRTTGWWGSWLEKGEKVFSCLAPGVNYIIVARIKGSDNYLPAIMGTVTEGSLGTLPIWP